MTELDFRRWIMRNFCELKEHVLNQCKETKELKKRYEEMITRMDNLERNMNELKDLKNTMRELREACTSFNSRIDQAEERISEVEDQLNEIKRETKIREKSAKRNEQSLQEMWDYVKRPNLRLIGVPECDKERPCLKKQKKKQTKKDLTTNGSIVLVERGPGNSRPGPGSEYPGPVCLVHCSILGAQRVLSTQQMFQKICVSEFNCEVSQPWMFHENSKPSIICSNEYGKFPYCLLKYLDSDENIVSAPSLWILHQKIQLWIQKYLEKTQ
uniref:L1 transposable element trimerization domain-containing protein n=1 Tax=Callithrix jacchus TaxID=9483 RepID=A0A8I3XDH1_CALJA